MQNSRVVSRVFAQNTSFRTAVAGLAVILAGLVFAPASSAEVPAQGSATITLGSGKAAKSLSKARVKVTSINADAPVRLSKGRVRLRFPVSNVQTSETRSVVSLVGSLVFSKGRKRVTTGQLSLVSRTDRTVVKGRLGGTVKTLFKAGGPAEIDAQVGTVAISGRSTKLAKGTARTLARKFKMKKLPAAKIGKSSTRDVQAAFADPYAEMCDLPATSKVAGDLPEPTLDPVIASPTVASGDLISWGFSVGMRAYLAAFASRDEAVMTTERGATIGPNVPGPFPPFSPIPSTFSWPFKSGEFNSASTGVVSDQVVSEDSGTVILCHKTQFRVNLSNPAIVIDGLRAQLVFDVDTNVLGDWIPTQRVALANLITSEGTRTQDESSISWEDVPVTLTSAGSDALRLGPQSPTYRYQAGQSLDDISFSVTKP